jgi:general stress protein 26
MPGYGIVDAKSGKGLLPWKWAVERLSSSKQYLLVTVRPDGRPHAMPIWGLWLDGAFYFSTGKRSIKARNLQENPNCVLCPDSGEEAVILEGAATMVTQRAILKKFARAYLAKYNWDVASMNEPVFVIRPRVVFGQIEKTFTESATRWSFDYSVRKK